MNNHVFFSSCICAPKSAFNKRINITKGIYRGTIIGKCLKCGVHKTVTFPSNFNAKTSRAKHYEERGDALSQEFQPLLSSLITLLPLKGSVIDVGASSGIFTKLCIDKGFDAWGIEPNKQAYVVGHTKKMPHYFNSDLHLFHAKYPKIKFDAVVYNHVLEHINDPMRELTLAKKILKKNGYLCIGAPNRRNVVFFLRRGYWESLMPAEHIWHFTDTYLKKMLTKLGFSMVTVFYANHHRTDLPLSKRVYFNCLTTLNSLFKTGEAVTVIAQIQ